jgi:hypothetical protein
MASRPVSGPLWCNKNRVVRVTGGNASGIVVDARLIPRLKEGEDLLGCLWIRYVVLLGKGRHSKADCQSY